jgi:hypothetical protein
MISTLLARALRDSGLVWHPSSGDNFVIDRIEADEEVFTLSDMTVEAHDFGSGTVLGFNGTTEWALDSVSLDDALWHPREDQLRELLAAALESLVRESDGWLVIATVDGIRSEFRATDAADAYARALLAVLDALAAD